MERKTESKIEKIENEKAESEVEFKKNTEIFIAILILKFFGFLICLYLFICSLNLMTTSFRLLGGSRIGEILSQNEIFVNPLAELMLGVFMTVVLQSSSTTTSIIITMIGAKILTVGQATFMIMGANIGTSITNTLVSMGQINNREEFRLAFSGATVHDMFNWLSVIVLLPLEIVSSYLQRLTGAIINSMNVVKVGKIAFLKAITKPFTSLIADTDSSVLNNPIKLKDAKTILKVCCTKGNGTCEKKCKFMFMNVAEVWSDPVIGGILIVLALATLIVCLLSLVKLLKSVFLNEMKNKINRCLNTNVCGCATGYFAIVIGCGMTILVQSSSVVTSAMTPLVGTGLIDLERMYAISLGANIGTTITAILGALAIDGTTINLALQASFIHLFFNISGIIIWYPIPFMRHVPINMAKRLGKSTSNYRWFAVVYILITFIIIPMTIFGLSLAVWWLPIPFTLLLVLPLIIIGIIKAIQKKRPKCLPEKLRKWKFLPRFLRSLKPYDNIMTRLLCCKRFKEKNYEDEYETEVTVF